MFSQVWKKYLPVITILMKRSVNGEQTLSMNPSDFQRAAGGRKIKFSFANMQLTNGRINNTVKHQPLAREFATILQEDEIIRKFLQQKHFEFSMNNICQLCIKNNTPPAEPVVIPDESNEAVLLTNTVVS
jgi:hypothetical protein